VDGRAVIDLQALAAGNVQPARVQAQAVQYRGMQVGDVVRVLDGMEAQLVGGAVDRLYIPNRLALERSCGSPRLMSKEVTIRRQVIGRQEPGVWG
jgi:hypothetical protein